jgi:hypothetical protein
VIEHANQRWLVAPYGAVNWVRNARAVGQVTLTRGRRSETVRIVELGPEDSAPVLNVLCVAHSCGHRPPRVAVPTLPGPPADPAHRRS